MSLSTGNQAQKWGNSKSGGFAIRIANTAFSAGRAS